MTNLMEERKWERDPNQTLRLNLIFGNWSVVRLKIANTHWLVILQGQHFNIPSFILSTSIFWILPMGHQLTLSSEIYKGNYDRLVLKWHTLAQWGQCPQEKEAGEQEVRSGVGRNQQRLKFGEGAQEGEKRSTAEIRKEQGVLDRRWEPSSFRNHDSLFKDQRALDVCVREEVPATMGPQSPTQ